MRIYLSYKYSGEDPSGLKTILEEIDSEIKAKGHKTFIFFRDSQAWGKKKVELSEVMSIAFSEIKKSDMFILYWASSDKSEGMLLEAGYAKAVGKKIILFLKKDARAIFTKTIADKIIEFDDIIDLKKKLSSTEL